MKISRYILMAVIAFGLSACGGRKTGEIADGEIDVIDQVVAGGNIARSMEMHVDSLAFMADDLTPNEAVQVLVTYMRIHEEAKNANDKKRDLETMRKFVDVYDIVMTVNSQEMKAAFDKLVSHNSAYDIPAAAKAYRALLADYGDGTAVEEEIQETPKEQSDSIGKDETEKSGAESAEIISTEG